MSAAGERRQNPRVKGPFEGFFDGVSGRVSVRIVDVSMSGCFIDSRARPESGEPILVEIDIGGERRIRTKGEVLYGDVQGFAVRFVDLPAETATTLADMIAQHHKSA
jgi:hypothetical protein